MRGRRNPNRTGAVGAALSQSFSKLWQAGDSDFDMSRVNTSGGKLVSLVDRYDAAHLLLQSDPTYQAPTPTTSGQFLGAPFASLAGHFYQSNRPASAWVFASNASSIYLVCRTASYGAVGIIMETFLGGDGISCNVATTPQTSAALYRTGVALTGAVNVAGGGTSPQLLRHIISTAQLAMKLSGSAQQTAALTGTATAAGKSLTIGARPSGLLPWNADLAAVWVFGRAHTADEQSTVAAMASARFGVAG